MSDTVAVVGLGQMGRGIAANLAKAGLLVAAWDIDPGARERVAAATAAPMLPPVEIAHRAEIVLLAVPASPQIKTLLDGPDGLLATPHPGQTLVDLTTSHPGETRRLAAVALAAGRHYLDCGMSGGASGAEAGRLTLMAGGEAEALARCEPAFGAIATRVFHVGSVGSGHTMKLVHNMVCHTNFLVLAEGCRLAERAGLDLTAAIDVINAGNARSYISEARFPNHILSGAFDGRSTVANLAKDLAMARDLAAELGQAALYGPLTVELLAEAVAGGRANDDFTTLYPAFDRLLERFSAAGGDR